MRSFKFWSTVLTVLVLSSFILSATAFAASGKDTPPPAVEVSEPVTPKLSPVMRDVPYIAPERKLDREEINPIKNPGLFLPDFGLTGTDTKAQDPLAANGLNARNAPTPLINFDGQGDFNLYAPPDTTGDVGPNHFVQMVNVETAIYDKTGTLLDQFTNDQLWDGTGGVCEANNDGDPIVLYDDMADRWLLSQFAVPAGSEAMCFAISMTNDPTGSYYLYEFPMPDFPDYPKIGVWPDGYYLGTNTGYPNQYYAHVFDRVAMLSGAAATRQSVGGQANFLMPADADGALPPPAGSPGVFYTFFDGGYPNHPAGVDRLAIFEFDIDWATPANTTFTLAQEIPIADFNYTTCGFFVRDCVPQLGTTMHLDAVDPWPMARLQYRNLAQYEAMVGNFTVDVTGTDQSGIRWFELRKQGADWQLHQEGTFAPDANYRFMGSIAMDGSGNIALGYSVSSASMYPSIRYTVHAYSDPLGTMQAESELMAGAGSQTNTQRWGDYSAMVVDPTDDCTFWLTNEYHDSPNTGFSWDTRIGAFRVPSCTGSLGYTGELNGTVTSASTSAPIAGANVAATLSVTQTFNMLTDANGDYGMSLPVGMYTVTASAYGYQAATIPGVAVVSGTITTQDFALTPAAVYTVSGVVSDANTGWPLYAAIDIDGYPGDPIWTDPVDGSYSVQLPEGMAFTFSASAFVAGYLDESAVVGPLTGDTTQNLALDVDTANCVAPGYGGVGCAAPAGGLVVGHVYDGNTSAPLVGATVASAADSVTTFATPDDPAVDDGFYTVYADSGSQNITASATDFAASVENVNVVAGDAAVQDFYLQTGLLAVSPNTLHVSVEMGVSTTVPMTLSNAGAGAVAFEIAEQSPDFIPLQSMWNTSASVVTVSQALPNSAVTESGEATDLAVIGTPSGSIAPEDIGTSWETMAPLPSARVFNAVVADTNGYVYVIGGTSDAGASTPTNTNFRYNTSTNTWDTMAPVPTAIDSIDGIAIGNKIYIPGGATTASTFVYDISANTWSTIAANGGYTARSQYQVVAIGSDLYVLGGIVASASASTTEVWVLDTVTGTWSAGVPMQRSRTSFSAAAKDGVIYVAGGVLFPGFTPDMTSEAFSGSTWSYVANVPNGGGTYTRWSYNADGLSVDGLWLAAGRRDAGWAVLNHAGYYDPATDTWTDSPTIPTLSQARVYMEGDVATDGYFYVIGGRDSAGTVVYNTNERLMVGYPSSDVPWVSEDPITGTVASLSTQVVDVTFDAGIPEVTQPGDYLATLRIMNDTPYGELAVPVTMTVLAPSTHGKIEGTVTGLGYCDDYPAPIEGAEVIVTSSSTVYTLTTDAAGSYGLWLDAAEGPLDITVTEPEHTAGEALGVVITAGQTTTQDFDLRLLQPCITSAPASFDVTLLEGVSTTLSLELLNGGALSAGFEISEKEVGNIAVNAVTAGEEILVVSEDNTAAGAMETALTTLGYTYLDVESTGFTAMAIDDLLTYEAVFYAGIPSSGSEQTQAMAYMDAGGKFYVSDNDIGFNYDGTTFYQTYLQATYVSDDPDIDTLIGEDIMAGINPNIAADPYPDDFTVGSEGVRIFQFTGGNAAGVAVARNGYQAVYTSFDFDDISSASDELAVIDAVLKYLLPAEIPWLSEEPITGTIAADGSQTIDLTFDTMTYTVGTYLGELTIKNDDVLNGKIVVPVTMTIVAPSYGVDLTPAAAGQNGEAGETVTYTLHISNTGNVANTFAITETGGAWGVSLPADPIVLDAGEGADFAVTVAIPADAAVGDSDAVTVTVSGAGGASDASVLTTEVVEMATYGVELAPAAAGLDGAAGETVTYTLQLTNTGNVANTFTITETGGTWAVSLPAAPIVLNAGESAEFTVTVAIPADAVAGDEDEVTITVSGAGDASASSVLTTRVAGYRVFLPIIVR
ncbi:MAG: Kelch repeat-containing protein [Chloroflexota bacterium]